MDNKKKLTSMIVFVIAVLFGLWWLWSIANYGLGVSTDSVDYMFTGYNLAHGLGYVSYDLSPFTSWPPFLPTLFAGLHILTKLDIYSLGLSINIGAYILFCTNSYRLFSKIFKHNRSILLWGLLMAITSPIIFSSLQNIGSDYVLMVFSLLLLNEANNYLQQPNQSSFWKMFIWASLGPLDRYIGIALIFTAMAIVFLPSDTIFNRVKRSGIQALAVLPFGIWLLRNLILGYGAFGNRLPPANSPLDNLIAIINTITLWFFPPSSLELHPIRIYTFMLGTVSISFVILAAGYRKYRSIFDFRLILPVAIFGIIYMILLYGSLNTTNLFPTDRFFLPVYLPMIFLGLMILDITRVLISEIHLPNKTVVLTSLVLFLFIPLVVNKPLFSKTISLGLSARTNGTLGGNMYRENTWAENDALVFLSNKLAENDGSVYSNLPAGVALYTWHITYPSPRKYAASNRKETYPLQTYINFATLNGHKIGYLIWIKPSIYEHVYTPQELSQIADLSLIFSGKDGDVYLIMPK